MIDGRPCPRRRFLHWLAGLGASGLAWPRRGAAASPRSSLAFRNVNTGELVHATYRLDGRLVPEECARIDWVLRDHRTDEVRPINRRLLDLLGALDNALGIREPFEVISGYRSPSTNARLAATTSGVSRRSLHVQAMAIDLRARERPLATLRDAALSLRGGGVGYYPRSNFVHVDVGRVRSW